MSTPEHEAQKLEAHLEAMPSIGQILAFIQIAGPIIAQLPAWIKQIQADIAELKAQSKQYPGL